MTTTSAISGATTPALVQQLGYTPTDTSKTGGSTLDKNTFLKLLVTQMQNQDPSSPMDSNTLMTQETQMSTMEQITNLADLSRQAYALQQRTNADGLLGQTVSYQDGSGATVSGKVTSVSFVTDVPTLNVDGKQIALDAVSAVSATTTTN